MVGGSSTGHAYTVPLIFLQLKNGMRNAAGRNSVDKVNSKAALKSTGVSKLTQQIRIRFLNVFLFVDLVLSG